MTNHLGNFRALLAAAIARRVPSASWGRLIPSVVLVACIANPPYSSAAGVESVRWAERSAPVFRVVASPSSDDARMPYTAPGPQVLAQDGTGFIWIGTMSGLERWDGYEMRTYGAKPDNECSLKDERVSTLFVDDRQRLWIGTLGGDMARYDPGTECIRGVTSVSDILNGAAVRAIANDGAGGFWIGSFGGLVHLAADLTSVTRLATDASEGGRLSQEHIARLMRDRAGVLWVGGDAGLARRGPEDTRFVPIRLPSDASVGALLQSADGRIWVGTIAGDAYVIDPSTLKVQSITDPSRRKPIAYLSRAAETSGGEIWFATANSGILAVDPMSLHTHVIHHQTGVKLSLVDDIVIDLMRDRNGLLWVTTSAGIGYFDNKPDVSTILIADESTGLAEAQIEAVARMADDRIAIGFRDQIALIAPLRTGAEKVPINLQPAPQEIISLATLNGRDLFAVTLPTGLVWIDRQSRHAYAVPLPGPIVAHIRSLLVDGDRLWVGGREGLWLLARRAEGNRSAIPWMVVQRFDVGEIGPLTPMAAGTADVRWFGTKRGIFRYDAGASKPRHVELLDSFSNPISDLIVTSLHMDARGRLWVGSNSQGLLVIDPSTESAHGIRLLRHFQEELPGGSIISILEDSVGGVWVATDRSVARIDAESFAVRRLGHGDGVAVTNYATGICATEACNELLFGGQEGFTVIDPRRHATAQEPPPVVVTRISVGHKEVPSAKFNVNGADQVLEVPADAQSVAVEFAALDYSDPTHNAYEYQLEGYDPDWVPTKFDTRMALYTNLAPGTYRLRMRGTDHAGLWSSNERQVIVQVAAAWYQTMGFHLLEAACAVMAVFLMVQARTLVFRQRQRELEALVEERTEALVSATQARNTLIENLAHDLRTPLTSLRGYLDRLNFNDETLSDSERGRYTEVAVRQVERLIRLVRELFELVRLDDPQARLVFERFSPAEVLQDVAQEFGSIAEGRCMVFEIDPGAESVQIVGDIGLFQRLIDNLVDNARRHTPAGGKIMVKLGTAVDVVVLEVRDTGHGIKEADRDRIFDRYNRGDLKERGSGAGLGLAIVKRILELHHGTIIVDSEEGAGTRFTVRLPLAAPALVSSAS